MSTATLRDEAMPRWQHREYHSVVVETGSARLIQAARDITWADAPWMRRVLTFVSLGRRSFADDEPILDMLLYGGYVVLGHTADELLIGAIYPLPASGVILSKPEQTLSGFRNFASAAHFKVVANFRFFGTTLSTETRVTRANGKRSTLLALYWCLVRPGSGLIRRLWLDTILRRAQR
jgi:hypothetical protein